MSVKPPATHKQWARHLKTMIPGDSHVVAYRDESEANMIAIFTSENDEGIVAATVGLMEYDQSKNPDVQICAELVLDSRGEQPLIGNVLSTIAFFVMKNGWKVAPGVVFEGMISRYLPDLEVKHVMFTSPFQWKTGMTKVELDGKTIYPLLAVPITSRELELIRQRGDAALEKLWEASQIDVLDWTRRNPF